MSLFSQLRQPSQESIDRQRKRQVSALAEHAKKKIMSDLDYLDENEGAHLIIPVTPEETPAGMTPPEAARQVGMRVSDWLGGMALTEQTDSDGPTLGDFIAVEPLYSGMHRADLIDLVPDMAQELDQHQISPEAAVIVIERKRLLPEELRQELDA